MSQDVETAEMHECMKHILFDLIDVMHISCGRKKEMTLITGLIIYLTIEKGLRMQDIARIFEVNRSTVTEYVDFLEKRGYITRVHGEEDRREVFIEPTAKGKRWAAYCEKLIMRYANSGLKSFTPEERDVFIGLLKKFVGDFDRAPYDHIVRETEKNTDFNNRCTT